MRLFMRCHALMDGYALPRLQAPLHVWWARETLGERPHRNPPDMAEWSVCGDCEVRILDGDHRTILSHPQLAEEFRRLTRACP